MKRSYCFICGLLLGLFLGFMFSTPQACTKPRTEVVRDTVTDTVRYYLPVPKDSVVIRYKTVKMPVAPKDTSLTENYAQDSAQIIRDSMDVEIPVTQKHYADSTYDAWVSGYEPNLDSIKVYRNTITERIYIQPKVRRWNIGIMGGYGITPKGFQPFLGVGVTYNILK